MWQQGRPPRNPGTGTRCESTSLPADASQTSQCHMLPTRYLEDPTNGFKDGFWSPALCCSCHVPFGSLRVLPAVCMKVGSDSEEQNGCQPPSPMMLPSCNILVSDALALRRHPTHSHRAPSSLSSEESSLSRHKQKSQPWD